MPRVQGCEAVYDIAEQWRDRCLLDNKSLLWPDLEEPTWTVENIERARDIMADLAAAKTATGGHMEQAFLNEPDAVKRVIADATAVWNLCPGEMKPETRRSFVSYVSSWSDHEPDTTQIDQAIEENIGALEASWFKVGFQMNRGRHLAYFLEAARRIKISQIDLDDFATATTALKKASAEMPGSMSARNMLLHMLFPDQIEPVFNDWAKEKIVNAEAFKEFSTIEDWDERLAAIAESLVSNGMSSAFNFYNDDVRKLWAPESTGNFSGNYWLFQCNPEYYSMIENLPGISIGERSTWNVAQHKDLIQDGDQIAFWEAGIDGGLVALGHVAGEVYESGDFLDPEQPGWEVDWILDKKIEHPPTRDDFKAHPLLRSMRPIAPTHVGTNFKVTPEQWRAMMDLIDGDYTIVDEEVEAIMVDLDPDLEAVAKLAYLDMQTVWEIDELLKDKKQLIFEGPPGSGKTFIADLFARYLTGNPLTGDHDERMEFVQFHQSYGYEDFVQGIRPRTVPATGHLRYDVQDGIFLQMCDRARNDPDNDYVLVIDEINRGNLSRIFGELMMALEYRNKKVKLSYGSGDGSGETTYLTIPENLYLIGTMNSTDRSLAMIDYALRRRFYFYPLRPVVKDEDSVLERWLGARAFSSSTASRILDWFLRINTTVIGHHGDDFQVGHSYFMIDGIEMGETREKIWRFAIKPLLEEYYHGHKERDAAIRACDPDRIWHAQDSMVPEEQQPADAAFGF